MYMKVTPEIQAEMVKDVQSWLGSDGLFLSLPL